MKFEGPKYNLPWEKKLIQCYPTSFFGKDGPLLSCIYLTQQVDPPTHSHTKKKNIYIYIYIYISSWSYWLVFDMSHVTEKKIHQYKIENS